MNMSNRAHGRTGMGAVMGSKNLKAIAVRGHGKVSVADREGRHQAGPPGATRLPDYPDMKGLQDYGTASVFGYQNTVGGLPTRNYASGVFEQAETSAGETMADTILKENDTCYACVVRCKRVVETEYKGVKVDPFYGGPEYETLGTSRLLLRHRRPVTPSRWRTRCATSMAWTPSPAARRSPLPWSASRKASSRWRTPAASSCASAMPTRCWRCSTRSCAAKGWATCWRTARRYAAHKIGRGAEDLVVAVKNQGAARAHAAGQAQPGAGLRRQPVRRRSPVVTSTTLATRPSASEYSLERMAQIGLTDPQPDRVLNREKVKLALYTQWNYSFLDTADLCQFVYGPSWQLLGPDEMVELMQRRDRLGRDGRRNAAHRRAAAEPDARLQRARRRWAASATRCPSACSTSRSKAARPMASSSRARSWSRRWTTTTNWPAGTPTACPRRSSWKSWGWAG